MMKYFFSLFVISLLMFSTTSAAKISNTNELIAAMQRQVCYDRKYSDIRGDVKLDPRLFDPQFWTTVPWKE